MTQLNYTKMPKFYKEPKFVTAQPVSNHQPLITSRGVRSNYTPDELEYESKQLCNMEDEEELPF